MLIAGFRLIRLIWHFAYGMFIALVLWPVLTLKVRRGFEQSWARGLLAVFNIRVQAHYVSPDSDYASHGPFMVLSNHVSWLDIFAFNSVHPITFIAKAEISSWPLAGILAKRAGTLFIERGKRHAVRDVIHAAQGVLTQGEGRSVAVFPEGTTGTGFSPLPFHSNLVQAAIATGVKVLPVSLQYFDAQGRLTAEPAFVGDQTLVQNIAVLLKAKEGFEVRLTFHAPLDVAETSRHELGKKAYEAIKAQCESGA